jgi:hypothetical protein
MIVRRLSHWPWVLGLVLVNVADVLSTRYALSRGCMEGNALLGDAVTASWFIWVKVLAMTGVGYWLARRSPKVLQALTCIYLGLIISNMVTAIRIGAAI